jgi:uncharacterized protein (TIGR03083 family)
MSDQQVLQEYAEVWWQAVEGFTDLLESLEDSDLATPTDLAGWDVRAVAAHVAHLERVLATGEEEHADIGDPPPAHITGLMGHYTEIGVVNRRDVTRDALVAEIREVTSARREALQADPPTDGDAKPERIFGGVPWSWRTLLRNRPLDVWMHEQDVRRAVGRPGGMDTAPAKHTAEYLAESMGFVLAKKVGAEPGTSLVLEMEGSEPFAFEVGEDRRGRVLTEIPSAPSVGLAMDRESFICLAGGRRPAPGSVTVTGDQALGERVVAAMATTP